MRRLTLSLIALMLLTGSLLAAIGYDPDLFVPKTIITCFKMEAIGRFDGKLDFTLQNGVVQTNMESFNALAKQYGIVDLKQAHSYVKQPEWNEEGRYLQCVYRVILADDKRMDETAAALSKDPNILYAELETINREKFVPNDPLITQQYALEVMHCFEAWDYVTGGDDVIIGITDSGVKWNHPDLAENIWLNPEEAEGVTINWATGTYTGADGLDNDSNGKIDDIMGWDFYNNDNNPYQSFAANYHGTHVAGCAGAVFDNNTGGSGSCPNLQIICCKGASNTTVSTGISNGYDQMKYAAENGAAVVNASWGGPATSLNYPNQIVDYMLTQGALFVTAAGNDNTEHSSSYIDAPSDCANALCVAATNSQDLKTDFSDYGATIDICAPGQAILSTIIQGNGYEMADGTSMASPLAAGVACLVKSINPELTPLQIRQRLMTTADYIYDINPDYAPPNAAFNMLGAGRVNAFAATMYDKIPYLLLVDNNIEELQGDGDGIPNPGELIKFNVQISNLMDEYTGLMWQTATDVVVKLRCDMPGVVVVDSVASFGTLGAGASNWNLNDQLTFQTVSTLPSEPIPFRLYITANPTSQYPYAATRYVDVSLSLLKANWPLNLSGASSSSACIYNLDATPEKEIIFGDQTGKIHAVKPNATELPNFPYVAASQVIGSLAMDDINNDGHPEIVANLGNSNLICLSYTGQLLWTAPAGGTLVGNPIIANVNGAGGQEVIAFTQNKHIIVLNADGTAYPNFPVTIEGIMLNSGAVADLDLDGNLEIVVPTMTGFVHAIHSSNGLESSGFPFTLGQASRNQPVIANLNGDNYPEILVPTYTGNLFFAINHDGTQLFQKNIGESIKSGAVVADVNADGQQEIVLLSYNGNLYLMDTAGEYLAGYPKDTGGDTESTPVIARFDGDNQCGIIFGDNTGKLHSFRPDGTESPNFPIPLSGNIKVSPAVDDIDGDGFMDIVFPNDAGYLFVDLKRAAAAYPWPFYMYNLQRSGNIYQNTPNEDNHAPVPATSLEANYPNPFRSGTTIAYNLKDTNPIRIEIYNLKGQKVKTLINETRAAGHNSITWNGLDEQANQVAAGVYLYRMSSGNYTSTRKMMLVR